MKKFGSFLFVVILTAGLTFVAVSGNFFMANLIIKSEERANQDILSALGGYQYAKYLDIKLVETLSESGDSIRNETSAKFVYNEDHEYDFAGHKKSIENIDGVETVIEFDFYYIDGILYIDNKNEEQKTKTTIQYEYALEEIFYFSFVVFWQPIDMFEEMGDEATFTPTIAFSSSPFYIGQDYNLNLIDEATEQNLNVTFKLDMLKHFRGMDYTFSQGEEGCSFCSNVYSYNKVLTLVIPNNLNTYVEA